MGSPAYDRLVGTFVAGVTTGHRLVNRWSDGRLEIRLPRGGRGIWIHTRGQRSGLWRRIPLVSVADTADPRVWIIAGSNGGQERLPGWVHNVRAHPHGRIEVARSTWAVTFDEVTGTERERCYAQLCRPWPMYRTYERKAGRPIPVFRCVPTSAAEGAG
ncbi:MAG: nitroreductase family deazaflavin-dependent oxidoreductase [Actinomycetales bacterium]